MRRCRNRSVKKKGFRVWDQMGCSLGSRQGRCMGSWAIIGANDRMNVLPLDKGKRCGVVEFGLMKNIKE